MTPTQRRAAAVPLLLTLALLAGCSGGDGDADAAARPSSGGTAATTASPSPSTAAQSVARLIQTGIAQAQGGDLDSAATTFGNALVIDPDNTYALYNLGLIAQTKKRTAVAVKYYDAALATDASYTPAMYNKAILLEATDLAGAATIYERIVAIDSQASTAYLRLGFAEADLGRAADAQAARATALQLDPTLADVPAPVRG